MCWLIGAVFFGIRSVTLLSGDTVGVGESRLRLLLLTLYVCLSLAGLAAAVLDVVAQNALS